MSGPGFLKSLLLISLCVFVSACSNTLYFMERTKAALSVEVSGTSPEPVELTVGYKRSVVALVPPRDSGGNDAPADTEARGEALSLLSRFQLAYDDDNRVHLENLFVTGAAARSLGSSVEATDRFLSSSKFSQDDTAQLVSCWLSGDTDGSRYADYRSWVSSNVSGVSPTSVTYGEHFQETRRQAIRALQMSCAEEG